ncbi:MAG: BamA/TamA family outer membrane protein, partial [Tabrizicola sp.]
DRPTVARGLNPSSTAPPTPAVLSRLQTDPTSKKAPPVMPYSSGITGGAFFDVGSVWSLDNTAGVGGAVDDGFNPRATVGLSVFWTTPIGPLRFNFSHAVKKEDYDKEQTFDLTISTKF